jgi:hypothetical protein
MVTVRMPVSLIKAQGYRLLLLYSYNSNPPSAPLKLRGEYRGLSILIVHGEYPIIMICFE